MVMPESTLKKPKAHTFGERIRWLRELNGMTMRQFAAKVGCDPGYISKLEAGKATNPSSVFASALAFSFRANWNWLMSGEGDPFISGDEKTKGLLTDWSSDRLQRIFAVLHDLPEALGAGKALDCIMGDVSVREIQVVWGRIRSHPEIPATAKLFWNDVFLHYQLSKGNWGEDKKSKESLDAIQPLTKHVSMPESESPLENLLGRVRRALIAPGAKAELARKMGVTRQAVNQWLRPQNPTAPTADAALRLWEMFPPDEQGREAKTKRSDSASTPSDPKTRSRQSYEKTKSSPPER